MISRNSFLTDEMYEEYLHFSEMSEEERKIFFEKDLENLQSMSSTERKAYKEVLLEGALMAIEVGRKEIEELSLYQKISGVSQYISLSQVATDYFGKTKQWLYQRLKNYNVNNKPATFTPAEKEQFRQALLDISRKIEEAALSL